jgi:hypothetical protein
MLIAGEGALSPNVCSSTLGSGRSSNFVDRAEGLLLFTSGAADETYWYGDALDDQFVTADME